MNKQKKPFVFIIFGPTAVGKTSFALKLAGEVPAEIINGDSGQFYTPFSIGTAKPDWKNEPVAHHLFDIVDEPKDFSVVAYRKRLIETVHDISSRGKLPIIVGGSGFYLKSLFFVPLAGSESSQEDLLQDKDFSWEKLHKIDPKRAGQIQKSDFYRIKRALYIWYTTGKKPSDCIPEYKPPFHSSICYLTRERQQLYDRINMRTGQMIQEGWLEEAKALHATEWRAFLYRKKLIGYDILFDYLDGNIELKKVVSIIQKQTRNYAKRQETFWRMFERQIKEVLAKDFQREWNVQTELANLTFLDRDLYIKQLSKKLRAQIS